MTTFTDTEAREAELIGRTAPGALTKAGEIAKRYRERDLSAINLLAIISSFEQCAPEIATISGTAGPVRVLLLYPDLSRLTLECANGKVRIR